MNMQWCGRIFAAFLLLGLATGSLASIREIPYALKPLHGRPQFAPGQALQLQFEVATAPGRRLDAIQIGRQEGIGAATAQLAAGKAGQTLLELRLIPTRGDAKLELLVQIDGELHVESLDLSELAAGELRRPLPEERIVDAVDPATAAQMWKPQPSLQIEVEPVAGKYNIRAWGRFLYWRPVSGSDMSNLLVGVDGAEVHLIDEDGFDNTLGTTTTDVNGNWEINVSWGGDLFDGEPDLAVKFDSGNSTTQVGPNSITTRYWWRTPVRENYTGTELNIGDYVVVGMRTQALHIHSTMVKAYRWYALHGRTLPGTAVHWPDPDWSYYTSWNNTIHMLPAHSFSERTITHELGHHYVNHFSSSTGPNYCNGVCDDPDCGHCGWCPENANDAWGEGFPNFIALGSVDAFNDLYSPSPVSFNAQSWEAIAACGDEGAPGLAPAAMTEGALTAVLRDLYDDDQDSDGAWVAGLSDRIQMPMLDFFGVAESFGGNSSTAYLNAMRSFIAGSPAYDTQDLRDFWEAARMGGFNLDSAAPSMPTPVVSNSHSVGVSNPNNFPYMLWTASTDDLSGVSHYLVSFSSGGPGVPTTNIGDRNWYTPSAPLTPGSYWFNVRAVDRSGLSSAVNSGFGPIVIAPATPLNLKPYWAEFWEQPALPSEGTSPGSAAEPTHLAGGVTNTYAQFSFHNGSPSGFSVPSWYTTVEIDGVERITGSFPAQTITGNEVFSNLNLGPLNVRGGRHMFICSADGRGNLAESSETDNWHGQQWVWDPQVLTVGVQLNYGAPPDRFGGWNKVSAFWLNRDGYSFVNSGWWNAVVMDVFDPRADYDLSLHAASTTTEDGFAGSYGYSGRGAGRLEAVFSNRNNVGNASTQYDVGILNTSGTNYIYSLKHITSTTVSYGSSFALDWTATDRMELREFYVAPGQVGPLSPQIQLDDPAEGPVTMMLLDDSFTLGDLGDHSAATITDATGFAQLDLNLDASGYYCLVFYRDSPGAAAKRGALQIDVALAPTLTNLLAHPATGWAAPMVPRPLPDGTSGSVPLPATLPGDVAGTYINLAMRNDSPIHAAAPVRIGVECDGQPLYWAQISSLNAGSNWLFNSSSVQTVPAGRHTLVMTCDSLDGFAESDEADNVYGVQYIWTPTVLPLGPVISRAAPRDPFGGVEGITMTIVEGTEEGGLDGGGVLITPVVWPNCDGVRSPQFTPIDDDGYWGGFALMSAAASNADLNLHELSTGATKGFAEDLAQSNWGIGHSDLVLVNRNYAQAASYDAGVLRAAGTQPYDIQTISSTFLAANPDGSYGDFAIPAAHIANLHEVYLEQGVRVIALANLDPSVRLGFSVYGPLNSIGQPYFGKSDTVREDAVSWLQHGGPLQYITLEIPQGGENFYCIAVWKALAAGLGGNAGYRLDFHGGATAVDPLPTRSTTLSVYPNPFNPRTNVAFQLERSCEVSLELFDLRGARVRALSLGTMAAGRHQTGLDGVDQRGNALASGRYLLKLMAGTEELRQPITLVK